MPVRRLVAIGTSSGGIDALRTLAADLPADFAPPICIVVHVAPHSPGIIHEILARSGNLPACKATDGMPLASPGFYVAPPDSHMLVDGGVLRLAHGPRENRCRPAIDPLFRSAARTHGRGVVGIVLTGDLDDGTDGLWTIKRQGGIAIAQDPEEALFPSMPRSAMQHVSVDHVVRLAELGPLLVKLAATPLSQSTPRQAPTSLEVEVNIARGKNAIDAGVTHLGEPSSYACPDCHGVLLQVAGEGGVARFRCHTGHAYSVASLVAALDDAIEDAGWNAVRSMEEHGLMLHRMAQHLRDRHNGHDADALLRRSGEVRDRADQIRRLIAGTSIPEGLESPEPGMTAAATQREDGSI